MSDPVKRHVGADRDALLAFVNEAHVNGYRQVVVAPDVAAALGAPTSTPILVTVSKYMPEGLAVAFVDDPTTANAYVGAFVVKP